MSSAFRLSEVHDVGNVAIITLREKGYRVWWEASERPSADDWWAEQEGRKFVARSPRRSSVWWHCGRLAGMTGNRGRLSQTCWDN